MSSDRLATPSVPHDLIDSLPQCNYDKNMSNIQKVLDRVRKLLSLSKHTTSEAEAAGAATRAAELMAEYQLSEALVRLDEPSAKPEAILKGRLEADSKEFSHKRIAWKETIAQAVADDLGVHMYFWNKRTENGMRSDIRGMGRESAIQAWQYTYQYLCRAVDELTDQAWEAESFGHSPTSTRSWKNAFRIGCSTRLAVRLAEKRSDLDAAYAAARAAVQETREGLALTVVEKDRDEVNRAYAEMSESFGTTKRIGQVNSYAGYKAGMAAGDQVSLGGGRSGLAAGQGSLTE